MRKTHGHTLLASCLRILGALGPASVYNDGDGDDGDGRTQTISTGQQEHSQQGRQDRLPAGEEIGS